MPEPETPLLVVPPSRDSNKKALKAAGLTLLACLLLAGQAVTAYMVVGQRGQLRDLDMRMHRLKEISSKSAVGQGAPMRMRFPMSSMSLLNLSPTDNEDSGTETPKDDASSFTQCQKEALGMVDTKLPSFRPQCDRVGGYLPQQCWENVCWCVDVSGKEIPNSLGKPNCANGNMRVAQANPATGLLLQPKIEESKE